MTENAVIRNRMGRSCNSCADYAITVADGIEQAKHIRERVPPSPVTGYFAMLHST